MEKQGLSSRGLQSTFWKLVRSGVLTWDELLDMDPDLNDSVTFQKLREWSRRYPVLSTEVYEEENPQNRGMIKDLSEKGIGVVGVHAFINEQKWLRLIPGEFLDLQPFSLEAQCRWFRPGTEGETCAAGSR
jgi:hypothetical protein